MFIFILLYWLFEYLIISKKYSNNQYNNMKMNINFILIYFILFCWFRMHFSLVKTENKTWLDYF